MKFTDFEIGENGGGDDLSGTAMGTIWRDELQRRYQQENDFLAELRARNAALNQTHNNHQQQMNHHQNNINNQHQDQQQHHPGEREEAEGEKRDDAEAEWSEALKNWVNR